MQPETPLQQMETTPAVDEELKLLHQVLAKLGNPTWDILLIGDGSGSGWAGAAGWAAALIVNNMPQARRLFYGACNCGSVNLAETMPYLQSLMWYDSQYGKARLKRQTEIRIHVITDSQTIAHWGTKAMSHDGEVPRKMLAFWAGMHQFHRVGYHCTFHWAPRLSTDLNWAADLIAGLTRKEVTAALSPTYVLGDNVAVRAANAVDNLVFYHPETQQKLDPYLLTP